MRHHFGPGFQLDPKPSVRKSLCDSAFNLEGLFFFSQNPTSNQEILSLAKQLRHPIDNIDVQEKSSVSRSGRSPKLGSQGHETEQSSIFCAEQGSRHPTNGRNQP